MSVGASPRCWFLLRVSCFEKNSELLAGFFVFCGASVPATHTHTLCRASKLQATPTRCPTKNDLLNSTTTTTCIRAVKPTLYQTNKQQHYYLTMPSATETDKKVKQPNADRKPRPGLKRKTSSRRFRLKVTGVLEAVNRSLCH